MLCQYVVVMYAGEVVEKGPTAEVIQRPRHRNTRALVGAIPQPTDKSRRGCAPSPVSLRPRSGCGRLPIAPRCPLAADACKVMPELKELDGVEVACWKAGVEEEPRVVAETR